MLTTFKTHHDTIPIYGSDVKNPKKTFNGVQSSSTVKVSKVESLQFDGEVECLDILVGGKLTLHNGFLLRCRTLTVLPTGTLEILGSGKLIIRDIPIDTDKDPFQFGNSLLNLDGNLQIRGKSKTTHVEVAKEIKSGDTSILLKESPINWNAGDKLVLPDTRQPTNGKEIGGHSEIVTVKSVENDLVTLESSVQYDHLGRRNQVGEVDELFSIGNLTRSIVIESENPEGTRGHVLSARHANVDVGYVEIRDMGRTTFEPLHNTKVDSEGNIVQIGENQIARYPFHFHHVVGRPDRKGYSDYQGTVVGLSVYRSPKHGIVVHGTHFMQVHDNVVHDCQGAHIMTEWPIEYGNEITNNLIVGRRRGSGQRITSRAHRNEFGGDHWHDNVGLGLASVANKITDNAIYSCKEGIGMAGLGTSKPHIIRQEGRGIVNPTSVWGDQGKTWAHHRPLFAYIINEDSDDRPEGLTRHDMPYPFFFSTSHNKLMGCWRGVETWTVNSLDMPIEVTKEKMEKHSPWTSIENYPEQFRGLLEWKMFPNLKIIHTKKPTDFEDQRETTLHNWTIKGDFSHIDFESPRNNYEALHWKGGYRFGINIRNTEVSGYGLAYSIENDGKYTRFINCKFECPYINYLPLGRLIAYQGAWDGLWKDCQYKPVKSKLVFIDGNYPKYDLRLWLNIHRKDRKALTPLTYRLDPWIDGKTYDIYHYEQHPDFELDPISSDEAYGDLPKGVYTQKKLIELDMPIFGASVPETAIQKPEFSEFWVNEVTQEPRTLEELIKYSVENRKRIQKLEGS